jgi:hypothetical protein
VAQATEAPRYRVIAPLINVKTGALAGKIPGAVPSSATVHPLTCAEKSPADVVADTQDPPGLTPGGPDQSHATVAQPVEAVIGNPGTDAALKPEGC